MAPFVSGQVCSIPTLDASLGIDALKDHLSEGINIQFEYMYFEHVKKNTGTELAATPWAGARAKLA